MLFGKFCFHSVVHLHHIQDLSVVFQDKGSGKQNQEYKEQNNPTTVFKA